MSWDVREGDCLAVMRSMAANSVDAIVTDPPSGISFMGREWDHDRGGRRHWIAWLTEVMREAIRVIRPGGHAFVWALPRTSHWTATALEDAGWEIRDVCTHLFASGFPKSRDIGKAIDQEAGVEREVVGRASSWNRPDSVNGHTARMNASPGEYDLTAPATEDAKRWEGWGTALKPASEHWILCRRPLAEPTVAANVLAHGTGALNIDVARIGISADDPNHRPGASEWTGPNNSIFGTGNWRRGSLGTGRWPSNALFSHVEPDEHGNGGCVPVGVRRVKHNGGTGTASVKSDSAIFDNAKGERFWYADADGTEQVPAFQCVESCPVRILDEQAGERKSGRATGYDWAESNNDNPTHVIKNIKSGVHYGDTTANASRFFFVSKSSRAERERGLEHRTKQKVLIGAEGHKTNPMTGRPVVDIPRANTHPTVKPLDLCDHLIKLVTPPGGTVLDMFCGSGSTGCSAARLGFNFIGIEQDAEYCDIARSRIAFWSDPIKVARYEQEQAAERARAMAESALEEQGYVMASLFGDDDG